MHRRRQQVGHVQNFIVACAQQWEHHAFGMAAHADDFKARHKYIATEHFQLSRLLQGQNILAQKRSLLPGIGLRGPLPMFGIAPESGLVESRPVTRFVIIPLNRTAAMVEMQVR